MVQYNKKIINNIKINNKFNQLKGGGFFSDLPFIWKLVIIGLVIAIVKVLIASFFKLKINGLVFPIIFSYLGYKLYTTLNASMQELGISLTTEKEKSSSKMDNILANLKSIIYSLPMLIPKIPKIPNPTFNYQPFEALREGIGSLKVPVSINGESYRLKINFPKLEIPFVDPLAGICCVWEQLKKLLELVEEAIQVPKRLVEKIFGGIKKVCTYIKEVVIMRMIRGILKIVGATTYPIIGMFMVIMKFLDFIDAFPGANVSGPKNDIQSIIDDLNDFRTGDFIGGNNYALINYNNTNNTNNNKLTLNDICYKINLLDYEEKIDKKCKVVRKMSIRRFYKIQVSKKNGLVRFVNKYKKNKFKKFTDEKFKKHKTHPQAYDYTNKYTSPETKLMNKKLKEQVDKIQDTTYNNYDLNEIKTDYNYILSDYNNIDKFKDIKNFNNINNKDNNAKQYGGLSGLINAVRRAVRMVNRILSAIADIPNKANFLCAILDFLLDRIQSMYDAIGAIQNLIFGKIPGFIQKIKDLIGYVSDIAQWFATVVIKKGIGIINAALDLVRAIGSVLPPAINEAIFAPINLIFDLIIAFLKLPFKEFFFTIVDILTNIPKAFKTFTDPIRSLCRTITGVLNKILQAALGPAQAVKRAAEKALEVARAVLSALSSFGGGSLMYNSGLEKILYKNKQELFDLLNIYKKLPHTTDNAYMANLEKMITNKEEKISNINNLLIKYNKKKPKKSKKSKKNLLLIKN